MKIKLPTFECRRCGHRWHPRHATAPLRCGFCKSPYWQKKPEMASDARERHDQACAACQEGS